MMILILGILSEEQQARVEKIFRNHHVFFQQPPGDVVLFRQAGQLDEDFQLFVLLRGDPEGHRFVPPAVVAVKIFHRHCFKLLSQFSASPTCQPFLPDG